MRNECRTRLSSQSENSSYYSLDLQKSVNDYFEKMGIKPINEEVDLDRINIDDYMMLDGLQGLDHVKKLLDRIENNIDKKYQGEKNDRQKRNHILLGFKT